MNNLLSVPVMSLLAVSMLLAYNVQSILYRHNLLYLSVPVFGIVLALFALFIRFLQSGVVPYIGSGRDLDIKNELSIRQEEGRWSLRFLIDVAVCLILLLAFIVKLVNIHAKIFIISKLVILYSILAYIVMFMILRFNIVYLLTLNLAMWYVCKTAYLLNIFGLDEYIFNLLTDLVSLIIFFHLGFFTLIRLIRYG